MSKVGENTITLVILFIFLIIILAKIKKQTVIQTWQEFLNIFKVGEKE